MRKKGAAKEKSWKLAVGLIAAAVLCAAVALFIWQQQPEYFTYRDQQLEAIKGVDRNRYDPQAFTQEENGWITYEKNGRKALTGIDVSVYQGDIDWEAVAQSGVEFAIIRLGYRGYSQGAIQLDRNFEQNMRGALEAGLDVGVYFFSQATTVLEAEEEADFVLENLRGYPITFPVVFDWEFVTADQARTHEMEGRPSPTAPWPSASWWPRRDIRPWCTLTKTLDTSITSWMSWTSTPSGWRSTTASRTSSMTLKSGSIPTPERCPVSRAAWT